MYWQRSLVVAWLVPRDSKCCRLCASSVYTIQPCTSLQCHVTSLTPALWAAGKMLSDHDHNYGLSLSEMRLAGDQNNNNKSKNKTKNGPFPHKGLTHGAPERALCSQAGSLFDSKSPGVCCVSLFFFLSVCANSFLVMGVVCPPSSKKPNWPVFTGPW